MRKDLGLYSLSLVFFFAACAGPDKSSPEGDVSLVADDELVESCFDTLPVKLSPDPVLRDIDYDGHIDQIDIFRGDSKHPLLARWDVQGVEPAEEAAVWASATHIVITLQAGVKLDPVRSAMSKLLKQGGLEFTSLDLPRTYRFGLKLGKIEPGSVALMKALLQRLPDLRALPGVAIAEPDYLVSINQQLIEPDDPKFKKFQKKHLSKILAPQAWFRQRGKKSVIVAVLDSGVDAGHPDLIPNLVQGRDFLRSDDDPEDEQSHGTYCAGLVGAKGDDNTGIAGLNWEVSLMPLKFIDKNGCGTTSQAAEAVRFAADPKRKVAIISASWGGFGESETLKKAIADASNVLFVASAGNHDVDIDHPQQNYIPAVFGLPNMLVVGASDNQDNRLANTARGRRTVHLSAPGDLVLSTSLLKIKNMPVSDPYAAGAGTSPAVALVAGAAALVKAENPNMSVSDLRCRLLKATDAIPALSGASCSGGRLNVAKAVKGIENELRKNVCGCP
jgi:subtilisin family serine protease